MSTPASSKVFQMCSFSSVNILFLSEAVSENSSFWTKWTGDVSREQPASTSTWICDGSSSLELMSLVLSRIFQPHQFSLYPNPKASALYVYVQTAELFFSSYPCFRAIIYNLKLIAYDLNIYCLQALRISKILENFTTDWWSKEPIRGIYLW